MEKDPNSQTMSFSSEEFIEEFNKEYDQFEKPRCSPANLGEASMEAVVKDVHRALFGNGTKKGLLWKEAEHSVKLTEMGRRYKHCRGEVVEHFETHKQRAIEKDRGLVAFAKHHPRVTLFLLVLSFFGISSLWSLILQERQATKIEEAVLRLMNKHIPITISKGGAIDVKHHGAVAEKVE